MVSNGKSYEHGRFKSIPILGNLHLRRLAIGNVVSKKHPLGLGRPCLVQAKHVHAEDVLGRMAPENHVQFIGYQLPMGKRMVWGILGNLHNIRVYGRYIYS